MLVRRVIWHVGDTKMYGFIRAAKTEEVKAGELKKIEVEHVPVEPMTDLELCPYTRHEVGHAIAIGESQAKGVDEARSIEYVLVAALKDGMINKGDVIGILKMTPVKMG